jgi:hypothetical protein
MTRTVLDDRVTIRDYWMAMVLVYAGHDLVSITPHERFTEFVILCPRFDYDSYYEDFHAGKLQIADAKRDGQPYINPDFDSMLRDEAERRQNVD